MISVLMVGIAIVLGSLSLFAALFMYEAEEGEWQNRFEDLWISIDDRAKLTGSRAVAIFNRAGSAVTSGLDRLFGRKLISLRSVGVSISCSTAVSFLVLSLVNLIWWKDRGIIAEFIMFSTAVLAFTTVVPIVFPTIWLLPLSYLPLIVTIFYGYTHWVLSKSQLDGPIIILTTLSFSAISDTALVAVARWSIGWISRRTQALPIILVFLLLIFGAVTVVALPELLAVMLWDSNTHSFDNYKPFGRILEFSCLFNVFTAIIFLSMAIVMFGLLFHRLFWPGIARLIYPVARYEIVRNRKFLIAVAAACFAFAFGLQDTLSKLAIQLLSRP